MKNYYLVIILFFILDSGSARAQLDYWYNSGPKVVPFEDYSKCQVGFLSTGLGKRDTVFPARFENLRPVGSPHGYEVYNNQNFSGFRGGLSGWTLSENNQFGFINMEGKIAVPFQYDRLEYIDWKNSFLAWKNGKCGMVSDRDSIIVPFNYDTLYVWFENSYTHLMIPVGLTGLKGVFGSNGKEMVPPVFEDVEPILVRGTEKDQLFFRVKKDSLFGIMNEEAKWIVPMRYKHVDIINENTPEEAISFFSGMDSLGYSTVFDETGKQIGEPVAGVCSPIYSKMIEGYPAGTDFIALRDTSSSKYAILSAFSGKRTLYYERINLFRNHLFYGTNEYFEGMMDTSFNVVFSTDDQRKLYYFEPYNRRLNEIQNYYELYDTEPSFLEENQLKQQFKTFREPSIMVMSLQKEPVKLKRKTYLTEAEYFSLWNVETGKQSPFIYNEVHRMISPTDGVYSWAVLNHSEEVRYLQQDVAVDIYDSLGILVNSICLDKKEYESALEHSTNDSPEVLLVRNDENVWSVMLLDGTVLSKTHLEFSHDYRFRPGIMTEFGNHNGIIRVNVPNGFRFMDYYGKPLLDGRIFLNGSFRQLADTWMTLKDSSHYMVVRNDLSILMDSCSDIVQLDYEASQKLKSSVKLAIIKDNKAYGVFNDSLLLVMNGNCFTQPFTKQRLCKGVWIDPSGNVLPGEGEAGDELFFKNLYISKKGNTLEVKNSEHVLIMEVPDVKHFKVDYEHIVVINTSGKTGWIGYSPVKWKIQPTYAEVYRSSTRGIYFARDSWKQKWCLIDSLGNRKTENIFDDRFTFSTDQRHNRFYSDGKIGIINRNFEIVMSPRFTNGVQLRRSYALKDQTGWYILRDTSATVFKLEDGFVDSDQFNVFLYIKNDSVWVRDREGNLLLPPTLRSDVEKHIDLASYLFPGMHNPGFPTVRGMFLHCSDTTTALTRINTELLLNYADLNIVDPIQLGRSNNSLYKARKACFRRPIWVDQYYYSEQLEGNCAVQSGYEKQRSWYRTYFVSGDSTVLIDWRDLYENPAEAEAEISLLIEKQIQERQLFGTTCGDMSGAVAEIKRNYFLNDANLYFLFLPMHTQLVVPLSQVKSPLKHPDTFQHLW